MFGAGQCWLEFRMELQTLSVWTEMENRHQSADKYFWVFLSYQEKHMWRWDNTGERYDYYQDERVFMVMQ